VHRGGRLPLVHVDAYRLHSLEEVDDLDLDVDLADSVMVVEWGSGLVEQLADAHLEIELARAHDSEVRTLTLYPHGGDWAQRVAVLVSQPSCPPLGGVEHAEGRTARSEAGGQ